MLDIRIFREDPETVKQGLARRGEDPTVVDQLLKLDAEVRILTGQADEARARRNDVNRKIGLAKRKPTDAEIAEMRELGAALEQVESRLRSSKELRRGLLLGIPNLPLEDVPKGWDESGNVLGERWGDPIRQAEPKPHWDFAAKMGLMDLQAGAEMSGARFYVLKGLGARLNRALAAWMLDTHTFKFGYEEVETPLLVRRETMTGSGNLPKFADNLYQDEETDLWLIPTGEVPLNALHAGKIIEPGRLPLKYVTHSPCFRKEHAAAGRDVRGIKRVHQFEKVEIFRFEEPDSSDDVQEEMLEEARSLCRELNLAHRVVKLCAGDIGFQSTRTFDIEVWAPGSEEWLEVSSISTCGDFQARRTSTRFRSAAGEKPTYPHTLNGSALALPRIWIAVLETGLQPDGSILLPKPLHAYMGCDSVPASE